MNGVLWMRGTDRRSGKLFSYIDLDQRVPVHHPRRAIRGLVNEALSNIGPELEAVNSRIGRSSIAPEKLLRALLLQLFHGIRSERQMMERLNFDLSFRWFVGLGIDDPVWDASTFSKNCERLLDGEIAARFLSANRNGLAVDAETTRVVQVAATARSTSAAPGAATTLMPRPPIRTRACIARVLGRAPSWATWDTS